MDVDLVVLGYCEGFGDEQGLLRELLVGLALENDAYQIIGQVGNGLTHQELQIHAEKPWSRPC